MFDEAVYDTLIHYLSERHLIRERRLDPDAKAPFTDDPILRQYKFTNVLRINDRTTQWLVNNWYQPNRHQPLEVQALNCAIARYFGRIEFLAELGYQTSWEPQYILEVARSRMARKLPVFTGAYIITNQGMTDPKQEIVVNHFLSPYRNALPGLVDIATKLNSWQAVGDAMKGLPGMGPFMTKEILLDWQLTPLLEGAVDRLTWTPAGPGAIRGLNRLAGAVGDKAINKGLTQAQALTQMKMLLGKLAQDAAKLPNSFPQIGVDFGITDIQFCLCELDKYRRVQLGEGRPRSTFKPFVKQGL
jgi:hypothetical protein